MVSRADRLQEVLDEIDWGTVETAQEEVCNLKDELQNWLDNMPENLQNSSKADELQSAIDELDEIESDLSSAVDTLQEFSSREVTFPSMF